MGASAIDCILHHGKIVTVDDDFSVQQAVALSGNRIVAVGTNGDILAAGGSATRRIDLGGRTLIPGFVDSHNHLIFTGFEAAKVPTGEARSLDELLGRITERTRQLPPGEWIDCAAGWHDSQLREKRLPTRWELDRAAPEHPVYLPRGGHTAVVNSLALQLAGYRKGMPNPQGGDIKRDANGELNGRLFESPAFEPLRRLLPKPSTEQTRQAIKRANAMYALAGITSVVEPGLSADELRLYQEMAALGELNVRTNMMPGFGYFHWPAATPENLEQTFPIEVIDSDMVQLDAIKLIADGGVETARMCDPIEVIPGEQEDPEYHGAPVLEDETLRQMVLTANRLGLRCGVHAVGDAAIEAVLRAYEEADRERSLAGRRFVLIHGFLPAPEHFARIRQLGVVVSSQIHNYSLGANLVKYWGDERAQRANPVKRYLDNGIIIGGGTDSIVCPYSHVLAVWADLTRDTRAAGVLGADQRLTREQAIRLHTIWAAAVCGNDVNRGSIEAGKLADLVVLDDDILQCPENDIKDLSIEMTVVGGNIVHANFD